MNAKFLVLGLTALFIIPMTSAVFAQSTYDVNIPIGAAYPNSAYFWQSEKDGSTTGDVEISLGDTIIWKNADTSAHTVTSGILEEGPDDIFNSYLFGPEKSFSHTFTETGHFDYYCSLHPWMMGIVQVNESEPVSELESGGMMVEDEPVSELESGGMMVEDEPVSELESGGMMVEDEPVSELESGGMMVEDVLPVYPPTNGYADIIISQNTGVLGCEILNNCYSPYVLSVNAGDVIEWYNADSVFHTVTSGTPSDITGEFDSGMLMSGESFFHTFENGGTFDYFDMLHPWMMGIVQVNESEPVSELESGTITIDSTEYEVSRYNSVEVHFSGMVFEYNKGHPVLVDVQYPNGETLTQNILVSSDESFSVSIFLDDDDPVGVYTINAKYRDGEFSPLTFTLDKVPEVISSSTNITLDSIPSSIPLDYGPFMVTGKLTTTDGTPLSGKSVWLQGNSDTGSGQGEDVITDSNGYFEMELYFWHEADPGNWEVFVVFEGDADYDSSVSASRYITVEPEDVFVNLSASIDKSQYTMGDTIFLTGTVNTVLENKSITIVITSPIDHVVSLDQLVDISTDGTFSAQFNTSVWEYIGTYNVRVGYNPESIQIPFEFVGTLDPEQDVLPIKTEGSMIIKNTNSYADYTIYDATLLEVQANSDRTSLTVLIDAKKDGGITINVPYDIILVDDENLGDHQVFLDGQKINFDGWSTNVGNYHSIDVSFNAETKKIEMVYVLPTPVPSTSNTILTLDPLPPSIKTGESITFSGRLVTSDGIPISKQTILIKDDDSFGPDDLVAKAVTDSSGYYANTIIAKNWDATSVGASEIYAVFEGTDIYPRDRTLIYEINVKSGIKNTSIIFDKLSKTATEGELITFSGRLLTDEGIPLEGKTIYLKQDIVADSDNLFATLTTDGNGYFMVEKSFMLPKYTEKLDANFYIKWDGDDKNNSFRTSNQKITFTTSNLVKDTILTLDPLPNKITEGELITFSGRLLTDEGIPLEGKTIYIKDDFNFDIDNIIKKTTTDSNGSFKVSWSATVRSSGSYDFYAVFEGEEKAKRDRSLTYSVYVTAIQSFEPIRVFSDESIFEIGDSLVIYGDATPNEELQIALMDPNQNIITSKTIQVSSSGSYSTTLYNWKQSTAFGDYVVVAWSEIDQRYDGFWISFIEGVPQVSETKITLDRPPSSIVLNEPITFSGKLTTVDGSPIKNGHVIIATLTAQTPESLTEGYTDSSGRYSITWYAKQTSSSGLVPVYAYYGGNQFLDSTASSLYDIKIEKPSLSVFTEKSTYDVGEQLLAYGYGNPNDRITVELKSAQGRVLNSEYSLVSSDGNYHTFFNLNNLSNGQYTIMVTSALYAISDSVSIQVESKIVTNEIDIAGNIHYNKNKIPLEGIKAVLDIGAQQHIDYADSAGNFEFKNIGFNPQLDYTLHFEMTDGKSFNFVDGEKFNAGANVNREANGEVISSKYLNLQLDNSKSTNHFSINLGDHLPYDSGKSSLITKGFDTQTKIVNFYSKVLNERPPIINIFLFGDSGAWYQSTKWDPSTNKVMSGYWQPRINVESSTNLMASFGMEYTHYVQDYAYKKMNGYDGNPSDGGHWGFNNPSTANSWLEGVGSFMPSVIADWEHLPSAGKFSGNDLESNKYKPNSIYKKWGNSWLDEEYSIATLLWDMYDSENEPGDNTSMRINEIWKLIKGFDSFEQHNPSDNHGDKRHIKYFKDFYDYLYDESNMSGDNIDDLFISHGIPQGWSAAGRP